MKTTKPRKRSAVGRPAPAAGARAPARKPAIARPAAKPAPRCLARVGVASRPWRNFNSAAAAGAASGARPAAARRAAAPNPSLLLDALARRPLDIDLTEYAKPASVPPARAPRPPRPVTARRGKAAPRLRARRRARKLQVAPLSVFAMSVLGACSALDPAAPTAATPPQVAPLLRVSDGGADAQVLFDQARRYQELGRHDLALALLQRATLAEPTNARILNGLGVSYAETGKLDAAVDAFRRADTFAPDTPHVLSNLGLALYLAGRPADAVAPLQRALALDGASAKTRRTLVRVLRTLGRADEARALATRAAGQPGADESALGAVDQPAASATGPSGEALAYGPGSTVFAADSSARSPTAAATPSASMERRVVTHVLSVPSTEFHYPPAALASGVYGIDVVQAQGRLVEVAPDVYEIRASMRPPQRPAAGPAIAGAQVFPIGEPARVVARQDAHLNVPPSAAVPGPQRNSLPADQEKPAAADLAWIAGGASVHAAHAALLPAAEMRLAEPSALPRDPAAARAPVRGPIPAAARAPARRGASTPPAFRLEVANGNGVEGAARAVGGQLAALGAPKARLTNERPFKRAQTTVYYRPQFEQQARRIAGTLSAQLERAGKNFPQSADVRVALGKDLPARAQAGGAGPAVAVAQGRAPAAARPYRLEVSNGNGIEGAARGVGRYLAAHGAPAPRLTNERPFRRTRTTVYYAPRFKDQASAIAKELSAGTAPAPSGARGRRSADVRVALGRDMKMTLAGVGTPVRATSAGTPRLVQGGAARVGRSAAAAPSASAAVSASRRS